MRCHCGWELPKRIAFSSKDKAEHTAQVVQALAVVIYCPKCNEPWHLGPDSRGMHIATDIAHLLKDA